MVPKMTKAEAIHRAQQEQEDREPAALPSPLAKAAQTALDIQNAVNLSGIVHAWAGCQGALSVFSTVERNRHPVNLLFVSKISSLLAVTTDPLGGVSRTAVVEGATDDLYREAHEICERLARESMS